MLALQGAITKSFDGDYQKYRRCKYSKLAPVLLVPLVAARCFKGGLYHQAWLRLRAFLLL